MTPSRIAMEAASVLMNRRSCNAPLGALENENPLRTGVRGIDMTGISPLPCGKDWANEPALGSSADEWPYGRVQWGALRLCNDTFGMDD